MANGKVNELCQRIITVQITVQMYREHAYTDSEIADTLKIKSEYREIRVLGVQAIEETGN